MNVSFSIESPDAIEKVVKCKKNNAEFDSVIISRYDCSLCKVLKRTYAGQHVYIPTDRFGDLSLSPRPTQTLTIKIMNPFLKKRNSFTHNTN